MELPILFLSIIIHECAHGYTAYKHGDDTAYMMGRLTLNPLAHIDMVGSILIPAVCLLTGMPAIGWAKPVPVNQNSLNRPVKDMALVALSGPASNIVLAAVCAAFIKIIMIVNPPAGFFWSALLKMFSFGVIINLGLACFNLIPITPLDGSHILLAVLYGRYPKALDFYIRYIYRYGMLIILLLVLSGMINTIVFTPIMFLYHLIFNIFGIF